MERVANWLQAAGSYPCVMAALCAVDGWGSSSARKNMRNWNRATINMAGGGEGGTMRVGYKGGAWGAGCVNGDILKGISSYMAMMESLPLGRDLYELILFAFLCVFLFLCRRRIIIFGRIAAPN